MRILLLNYEWPPLGGGASPVSRSGALALAERGHHVDVVTMGFRGLPPEEQPHERVRVFRVRSWRTRREICRSHEMMTFVLPAFLKARRLHRETPYRINWTHFAFPTGPAAWLLDRWMGLPYVIASHGSDIPGYNPERFRMQHHLLKPLWRIVVRNARHITVPSQPLLDLLNSHHPGPPTSVLPNGMEPWPVLPDLPRAGVLCVSRLFEWKGFQTVLEALPEGPVTLVGDGPYRSQLEAQASRLGGNVRFTGWLDRDSEAYRECYARAKVFVFPSERDSFGMVLLEAMMAGLPCVVAQNSAPAGILGEAGLTFEPRNPASLRSQVLRLLEDEPLRREMGKAARMRAEAFTWPRIAERLERILEEASEPKGIVR